MRKPVITERVEDIVFSDTITPTFEALLEKCCVEGSGGGSAALSLVIDERGVYWSARCNAAPMIIRILLYVALTAPEKKEYKAIQAASERVLGELARLTDGYVSTAKQIEALRADISLLGNPHACVVYVCLLCLIQFSFHNIEKEVVK
jgi:hypothetical protein